MTKYLGGERVDEDVDERTISSESKTEEQSL